LAAIASRTIVARWAGVPSGFVRCGPCVVAHRFGDEEMPVMNRIEAAAENADAHAC
jgi:hypothetical protein